MTGRSMITAALAVYSSRTTVIFFNTNTSNVEEYTLRVDSEDNCTWDKTKD